jgi:uncharacterized repeat protein (TIGR03803 family)
MHRHDFSLARELSHHLTLTIALAILTLALSLSSYAQTETVIYSFVAPGHDGHTPYAAVVFDSAGNLYGTTYLGGTHNFGTVYELSPVSGGGWVETVLHSFTGGLDGGNPQAPLILDASGNLYGTTILGGSSSQGTVFELSPVTGGGWHETVLHSFSNGLDGANPTGALVFDSAGNLYGTVGSGGIDNHGIVFEMSPPASGGTWHFSILHSFTGGTDGRVPFANLIFDSAGNIYGTTAYGGNSADCVPRGLNGCGVAYELSPTTGGGWHETLLHTFTGGHDGAFPIVGLTFDASGNLYGSTYTGGDNSNCITSDTSGCGVVFQLSQSGGVWHETTLHAFSGAADGSDPNAVIPDSLGNVYGSTQLGGDTTSGGCDPNGCGVVFELSPLTGGGWHETILHDFTGSPDGTLPAAALIFDSSGNLYGTTAAAGADGQGTIFEITP